VTDTDVVMATVWPLVAPAAGDARSLTARSLTCPITDC